jgi:hypothetical protein
MSAIKSANIMVADAAKNIAAFETQLSRYQKLKDQHAVVAAEQMAALDRLSIDFTSLDEPMSKLDTLAQAQNIRLDASFKGVLESLRTFDAYLSAIFFPNGVSATYNVEKQSYMLQNGTEAVREITPSELYVKAKSNGGFTGAEITFTKPFVNVYVKPNGSVDTKWSYILYPFVFRYNEQGGAVLASARETAIKRQGSYVKIHPHLRSVSALSRSDNRTHYGFGWDMQNEFSHICEIGNPPCLGSLSSHISTAMANRDLAFLIRGMLNWATSNSGPDDTWSRECESFQHISLKSVLDFIATPYESLKLEGMYFDKEKAKTYALFSDPVYKNRASWFNQVPQFEHVAEPTRFYLYDVPCTYKAETSLLRFDVFDINANTLLSRSATRRLRRLTSAILLPEVKFTNLDSVAEITIPSEEPKAPSVEISCVP